MRNRECLISSEIGRDNNHSHLFTLPRIIQEHMNLKGALATGCQVDIQLDIITLLYTFKGLYALGVLSQATKAKVLETDDAAILNAGQVHGVVPDVVVVLHPVVAVRTIHKAGITSTVVIIWLQTENLEALAGHLCTSILVAIGSFRSPYIILGIRVVSCNLHHTALGNRFFVPCNLDGSDHCLTGIAKATGRTVVEDIPLTIDFLQ